MYEERTMTVEEKGLDKHQSRAYMYCPLSEGEKEKALLCSTHVIYSPRFPTRNKFSPFYVAKFGRGLEWIFFFSGQTLFCGIVYFRCVFIFAFVSVSSYTMR